MGTQINFNFCIEKKTKINALKKLRDELKNQIIVENIVAAKQRKLDLKRKINQIIKNHYRKLDEQYESCVKEWENSVKVDSATPHEIGEIYEFLF